MKIPAVWLIIWSLVSCAGAGDPQGPTDPLNPAGSRKTPQGYVAGGDPERFGGFIGNCTSDENFPFYWQCQSENAGNDFH